MSLTAQLLISKDPSLGDQRYRLEITARDNGDQIQPTALPKTPVLARRMSFEDWMALYSTHVMRIMTYFLRRTENEFSDSSVHCLFKSNFADSFARYIYECSENSSKSYNFFK